MTCTIEYTIFYNTPNVISLENTSKNSFISKTYQATLTKPTCFGYDDDTCPGEGDYNKCGLYNNDKGICELKEEYITGPKNEM